MLALSPPLSLQDRRLGVAATTCLCPPDCVCGLVPGVCQPSAASALLQCGRVVAGYSWPPRAAAETWHLWSCSHTRMLGSEFPVTVSKLGSLAIPDPHLLEFSGEQSLQTALELLPDTHLGSWTQGRWWVPHELDRLGGDTAREDHVQAGGA